MIFSLFFLRCFPHSVLYGRFAGWNSRVLPGSIIGTVYVWGWNRNMEDYTLVPRQVYQLTQVSYKKIYTLQAPCVDYSLLFASHNRFYNWRFEKMLSIGSSIISLNKLTLEYTKWIHQLYWAHRHVWDWVHYTCSRLLRVVFLCEEWQDQILY